MKPFSDPVSICACSVLCTFWLPKVKVSRMERAAKKAKINEKENEFPDKRRLSLSLKKKNRFLTSNEEQLESMSKPQVLKYTEVNTKWGIKYLQDWFHDYNQRHPDSCCPDDVFLPKCSKELLNKWLFVFVLETRARNGDPYPPKTLHSLLTGILRHMRTKNPDYPNFLDKDDSAFVSFRTTLDNLFKSLREKGIGATAYHTEGICKEEEEMLRKSSVLNIDTLKGLLRSVFYYNDKCFCLRGGQEQRELSVSQFERGHNPECYIYSENASKNRMGGLLQMRLEHKSVTVVANPDVGSRCHVHLLDKYISKLPPEAIEKNLFYCRPLSCTPKEPSQPWYMPVPVGKNTLCKMVSEMCEEAGISGKKTNHSLQVSGASSLFSAGVPERIIQQRTGHRSLEALRLYERVTVDQNYLFSNCISNLSLFHF